MVSLVSVSMYKFILLLVLGCFSISAICESTEVWSRRDSIVDPFSTDEEVLSSWVGGEWRDKGLEGVYRIVVTHSYAFRSNKFYLQWMLGEAKTNQVAYSIGVKELNEIPFYKLNNFECLDKINCASIAVNIRHIYEPTNHSFKLDLYKLGHYKFAL